MPTRRCNECELNLPVRDEFQQCPKCEAATTYHMYGVPHLDWEERVAAPVEEAPDFAPGDAVTAWRFGQLLKAGYEPLRAWMIAADRSIDLHKAVELAATAGPEMAYRIVS